MVLASGKTNSKTRTAIIEAAGKIFAEEGYLKATVRDICSSAGANLAAVNYYFGDKKGLYLSVLKYYQEMAFQAYPPDLGIRASQKPEEKLRIYIRMFLKRIMDDGRPVWFGRLLAREFSEPTCALDVLVNETIRPSFQLLTEIVADVLGKTPREKMVRLCSMSIVGQCLYFRHSQPIMTRIYPEATFGAEQIDEITEHIASFSIGGLRKAQQSARVKKCKKR